MDQLIYILWKVFFVILCFSPTMGMVEGKVSKNGSKWAKMQENFTSDDFPRKIQ